LGAYDFGTLTEVLKRLPHNATPEQVAEQVAELTSARIAAERKAKAEAKDATEQVA
jgi:hypothetical protein